MTSNILITNDDGFRSIGIRSLVKNIRKYSNVTVVAPDSPRSAAGLSLTFYRPLRINEYVFDDIRFYAVNGTPGDCVTIGIFYICEKKPDMVLSGINIGENISLIEFFMSGTVAAAILASIYKIPAIAFSKREAEEDVIMSQDVRKGYEKAGVIASEITKYFLDKGFPESVDLITVNFPLTITKSTHIVITHLSRLSLLSKIYPRDDPRGRPYYWIWGEKLRNFPKGTDGYETRIKGNISVTPISLTGMNSKKLNISLKKFEEYMTDYIKMLEEKR